MGLSKKGHSFTILSFEKQKRFDNNELTVSNMCKENHIIWKPLSYTKNPPVLATIFDIRQLHKSAFKLQSENNFDIVHCRSYITALTGLNLKRKHNIKFIFDMRGFWADERVDGNLWNLNNPIYKGIYKFFKKKERAFLLESDAIISLTEIGKDEMISWESINLSSDKITVIPCVADFKLFNLQTAESKELSREKLNILPETFVLSYLGSLGTWYMLDEMIHFFSVLKTEIPNSIFLFLTPDSPEIIFSSGRSFGLDSSDFKIKFADRQDIPKYMLASDYSIFFIQPKYSKLSSSPTKMGELMAMGIPIICNSKIGDVEEIIRSNNAGLCIHKFTEEIYLDTIQKIQSEPPSSQSGLD